MNNNPFLDSTDDVRKPSDHWTLQAHSAPRLSSDPLPVASPVAYALVPDPTPLIPGTRRRPPPAGCSPVFYLAFSLAVATYLLNFAAGAFLYFQQTDSGFDRTSLIVAGAYALALPLAHGLVLWNLLRPAGGGCRFCCLSCALVVLAAILAVHIVGVDQRFGAVGAMVCDGSRWGVVAKVLSWVFVAFGFLDFGCRMGVLVVVCLRYQGDSD
jgi:hypothetical protein